MVIQPANGESSNNENSFHSFNIYMTTERLRRSLCLVVFEILFFFFFVLLNVSIDEAAKKKQLNGIIESIEWESYDECHTSYE